MFGTFTTPGAIFHELELVGSVGFVLFGKVVLGAAGTAEQGDKNAGCFFCFGHDPYFIAKYGKNKAQVSDYKSWLSKMALATMLAKNSPPGPEGWRWSLALIRSRRPSF